MVRCRWHCLYAFDLIQLNGDDCGAIHWSRAKTSYGPKDDGTYVVSCLPEGCSRACVSDFKTAGVTVASRQLGFNPIDISAAGICRSQDVDKVRSGATKLDE